MFRERYSRFRNDMNQMIPNRISKDGVVVKTDVAFPRMAKVKSGLLDDVDLVLSSIFRPRVGAAGGILYWSEAWHRATSSKAKGGSLIHLFGFA